MKVISRQDNSRMCLICGLDNNSGVKAPFYNMEDGSVASVFMFAPHHQSYPGRTHGGMISTMLDELMGRVLWVDDYGKYAVTMNMSIKFRKPVPYNVPLKARAYTTKSTSRYYIAKGQIFDENNNILAEGEGSYFILPPDKVVDGEIDIHEEMCYHFDEAGISNIDFPPIETIE